MACKYCDQGIKLTGKDHWLVQSVVPARIKIVRCGDLKDIIEWIVASDEPRVTQGGYKSKAMAERAAKRANEMSDWPRWHVEKQIFELGANADNTREK